jgi:hypothetical protein
MKITSKAFITYILWTFLITWLWDGICISFGILGIQAGYLGAIFGAIAALAPTISVCILLRKYGEIDGRKSIREFILDMPKNIAAFGVLAVFMVWRLVAFYSNGDLYNSKPLY